jgi:SAM-dependent methyltransferase
VSFANHDVLNFYKSLPFNMLGSQTAMAAQIRQWDASAAYPQLQRLLVPGSRVLEAGCGTGWFTNSVAYHHRVLATGIDFNPVAIDFAAGTAASLGLSTTFTVADLFLYESPVPYDTVVSLGVLHHTNDCIAGVAHVLSLVAPGGHAFIGLYHLFGRAPFLDHFAELAASGASEHARYARFKQLFGGQAVDETHIESWFRDQVLHPHETQHTLAEMIPVIDAAGMELVSTSVNAFEPIADLQSVLDGERELEAVARRRLESGAYFPGFFLFLVRRPIAERVHVVEQRDIGA